MKNLILLLLAVIILSGCGNKTASLQKTCEDNNAVWHAEYNECDDNGISSNWDMNSWCYNMGGQYNECASPCRHFKDQRNCIQVCYRVCDF